MDQKINCDVETCEYNDTENEMCTLKKIKVSPVEGKETKEPDESMCSSYKHYEE